MDPRALLDTWLTSSALRPSTQAEYRRELLSWLTWCDTTHTSPWNIGPEHIAAWSEHTFLHPYLNGRPFDSPEALARLATDHPEAARSHDRRISALTQYYDAATRAGALRHAPDLTILRSGLDRDPAQTRRLTPRERAVFLATLGAWGPHRARQWQRDQLICYLLLDGLRPAQVVRLDERLLEDQPDGSIHARIPDDTDGPGRHHTLDPLTAAAITHYRTVRPTPQIGVHTLVLGQSGRPVVSRYPNMIVRAICDTHPLLADRQPPVTADTIAHTGLWDEPNE
ncbi:hypothetical protein [Streptomyces sp. NPDC060243]|uniref:hypothetical protein n=1 Tax=Streptomyces sp. NPDC060243 TaxID=3347081 RepID=UPI00365B1A70